VNSSQVYGGQTLFDQFNADIQRQIELFCVEIKSILGEAVELLERRYGVVSQETPAVLPSVSPPHSPFSLLGGRRSPSLPSLLRWSLRDKKRVEAILHSFKDRNTRLKAKVELWCLASQLGVFPDHLRHLQTDDASRALGFDKDASLRLAQWQTEDLGESLELTDRSWDSHLKEITAVEHQGMFAIFTKEGRTYIQENHHYSAAATLVPLAENDVDPRTKMRVESLARLLHQPKERVFRILSCTGWKYLPGQCCIAFVFEVQPKPIGAPVSLQRLLFNSNIRPGLGDRFRLALGLSKCVAQMHMVQWVCIFILYE
jgi:hypothetical protein